MKSADNLFDKHRVTLVSNSPTNGGITAQLVKQQPFGQRPCPPPNPTGHRPVHGVSAQSTHN